MRCETTTFPPTDVTWILISEDYPEPGTDVAELTQFNLTSSGSMGNFNLTRNAIVAMTNLTFEDDGNFTCYASNVFAESRRSFRLRVKCVFTPPPPLPHSPM